MYGLVCVFEKKKWRYKLVSAAAVQLLTPLINRPKAQKNRDSQKTNKCETNERKEMKENKNTVDIITDNISIT